MTYQQYHLNKENDVPLNNPAMVIAANALRAAMTHMQLHSGDPGASGTSNVTTAARQAVTWSAATSPFLWA